MITIISLKHALVPPIVLIMTHHAVQDDDFHHLPRKNSYSFVSSERRIRSIILHSRRLQSKSEFYSWSGFELLLQRSHNRDSKSSQPSPWYGRRTERNGSFSNLALRTYRLKKKHLPCSAKHSLWQHLSCSPFSIQLHETLLRKPNRRLLWDT